jgi:hypothetical protein
MIEDKQARQNMQPFGRKGKWHQGVSMSAKPELKNQSENDSFSGETGSLKQDIFTEDDPAVRAHNARTTGGAVNNPEVSSNLKAEKLAYIHEMLGELRKLSNSVDEPMIAYLIEMALLETDTAINLRHFNLDMGPGAKGIF